MQKKAFITGLTGQDGAYLADFLLSKDYQVHGLQRRASTSNLSRVSLLLEKYLQNGQLKLHEGDLSDTQGLNRLIGEIEPDEIYNLAAQSHVGTSFELPEYTADINGLGALRILEAIRLLGLGKKTRFYQASTSELFGKVQQVPQKETTPFYPRSPYAVAKLFAYWTTVNYREAYGFYACNGILFNHESPLRGENFVTKKITKGIAQIIFGKQKCLYMGNLDSKRDWGHAKDYVVMQWMMLQQKEPQDFVIATGQQHSVREFIELAFRQAGIEIAWKGEGVKEVGVVSRFLKTIHTVNQGDVVIAIDPKFFRPTEVETLLGDASLALQKLQWKPRMTFEELVREMIEFDLKQIEKQSEYCL